MTKKEQYRLDKLMPEGVPKYIRVYESKDSVADPYTVVYTGNYRGVGWFQYVGMSGSPFWPQGVCQHGESPTQIDRPTYGHLGKRIGFWSLPPDCRKVVIRDYRAIWNLPEVES